MEHLLLFMEAEEGEAVKNSYELEDGLWKLKKITSGERKELAELLSVPEMIVTGLSGEEEAQSVRKDMGLPAERICLLSLARFQRNSCLLRWKNRQKNWKKCRTRW